MASASNGWSEHGGFPSIGLPQQTTSEALHGKLQLCHCRIVLRACVFRICIHIIHDLRVLWAISMEFCRFTRIVRNRRGDGRLFTSQCLPKCQQIPQPCRSCLCAQWRQRLCHLLSSGYHAGRHFQSQPLEFCWPRNWHRRAGVPQSRPGSGSNLLDTGRQFDQRPEVLVVCTVLLPGSTRYTERVKMVLQVGQEPRSSRRR